MEKIKDIESKEKDQDLFNDNKSSIANSAAFMQIEKAAETKNSSNLSMLNENISPSPLQMSKIHLIGQPAGYEMPDASPVRTTDRNKDLITAGER